ncbi:MAG TPA: hypothetical protein VL357_02745 [Rariglobus sp.]|jgi:hypothetical protein|nr:hypothetical protein [Rariglobus sp.]
MGEQGDGALMVLMTGIMVKPFVCCRTGRHHSKQQNQRDQQH